MRQCHHDTTNDNTFHYDNSIESGNQDIAPYSFTHWLKMFNNIKKTETKPDIKSKQNEIQ